MRGPCRALPGRSGCRARGHRRAAGFPRGSPMPAAVGALRRSLSDPALLTLSRFLHTQQFHLWRSQEDLAESVHPSTCFLGGLNPSLPELFELVEIGEFDLELERSSALSPCQWNEQPRIELTMASGLDLALDEFDRALAIHRQYVIRKAGNVHGSLLGRRGKSVSRRAQPIHRVPPMRPTGGLTGISGGIAQLSRYHRRLAPLSSSVRRRARRRPDGSFLGLPPWGGRARRHPGVRAASVPGRARPRDRARLGAHARPACGQHVRKRLVHVFNLRRPRAVRLPKARPASGFGAESYKQRSGHERFLALQRQVWTSRASVASWPRDPPRPDEA